MPKVPGTATPDAALPEPESRAQPPRRGNPVTPHVPAPAIGGSRGQDCVACDALIAGAARFCRSCGAEQPTTQQPTEGFAAPNPETPTASTGSQAEAQEAIGACQVCGAPVPGSQTMCQPCGALAYEESVRSAAEAAPAPAERVPAAPPVPPAQPVAKPKPRRAGFIALIVVVVVVFGGAGGAGAYVAFLKPDDAVDLSQGEPREDPAPTAAGGAAGPGAPAGAGGAPEAGDSGTQRSEPRDPQADDSGGEQAGGGSTAGAGSVPSPEEVLRSHFELIDEGKYKAAWRLFHPAYRDGKGARWVSSQNAGRPRIDLDSLEVSRGERLQSGMRWVDVDLVAADSAGDGARLCRHFVGQTRMQRVDGRWLYRPGEVDGVKPSLAMKPISDSDERCRRVLD